MTSTSTWMDWQTCVLNRELSCSFFIRKMWFLVACSYMLKRDLSAFVMKQVKMLLIQAIMKLTLFTVCSLVSIWWRGLWTNQFVSVILLDSTRLDGSTRYEYPRKYVIWHIYFRNLYWLNLVPIVMVSCQLEISHSLFCFLNPWYANMEPGFTTHIHSKSMIRLHNFCWSYLLWMQRIKNKSFFKFLLFICSIVTIQHLVRQ